MAGAVSLGEETTHVSEDDEGLQLDQNAVAKTLGLSRRTVQRKWMEAREMIAKSVGEAS